MVGEYTTSLSFPGRVDYDGDFMSLAMSNPDPPDLWLSTPDDQFPDPKVDLDGFMVYCGESYPRLTSYLWLVTREMVEKGVELKPIAMHEPFFSSKFPYSQNCMHRASFPDPSQFFIVAHRKSDMV